MLILDFVLPRSCVFCGVLCEDFEKSICIGCFNDLPWCDAPVSPLPGSFECSIAMLHYAFPVDVAIKSMKFGRKLYYLPAFSQVLGVALSSLPEDIDAVLPVPLHWHRKALRGFNQARELAKPIAKVLKVPIVRGVRRTRSTPFQSGLDVAQRARNMRHAFSVGRADPGSHVLIIDDVITTGATTRELAKRLLASGVKKVSVLTVARTGS